MIKTITLINVIHKYHCNGHLCLNYFKTIATLIRTVARTEKVQAIYVELVVED